LFLLASFKNIMNHELGFKLRVVVLSSVLAQVLCASVTVPAFGQPAPATVFNTATNQSWTCLSPYVTPMFLGLSQCPKGFSLSRLVTIASIMSFECYFMQVIIARCSTRPTTQRFRSTAVPRLNVC
jgi:hypothetical protein